MQDDAADELFVERVEMEHTADGLRDKRERGNEQYVGVNDVLNFAAESEGVRGKLIVC